MPLPLRPWHNTVVSALWLHMGEFIKQSCPRAIWRSSLLTQFMFIFSCFINTSCGCVNVVIKLTESARWSAASKVEVHPPCRFHVYYLEVRKAIHNQHICHVLAGLPPAPTRFTYATSAITTRALRPRLRTSHKICTCYNFSSQTKIWCAVRDLNSRPKGYFQCDLIPYISW